ncbi:hypothetical protein [Corynebacterium sp. CCM 9204]|uniref:hypothetical protein n=1 Tax=Corynebacterium sp. CCM 9204 TaxID=3057616 RepID=UPI003524F123
MSSEEIRDAPHVSDLNGKSCPGNLYSLCSLMLLLSLAAFGVFVGTDMMNSDVHEGRSIEQRVSATDSEKVFPSSEEGRISYSTPDCDGSGVLLLGDYATVEDAGMATSRMLGATYTSSTTCGSLGGDDEVPEYFVVYLPVLGGREDLCQALESTRARLDLPVRATLLDERPHSSESLCPQVSD